MWIDRRWLIPGAALSLLLNVFLVGVVASHVYTWHGGSPERHALVSPARLRALPAEDQAAFVKVMAARHPAIVAARQAQIAARRKLEMAIVDPAYDKARVAQAFADLRHATAALQETSNAALTEAFASLSPTARAALVARPPDDEEAERR